MDPFRPLPGLNLADHPRHAVSMPSAAVPTSCAFRTSSTRLKGNIPPEVLVQYINVTDLIKRAAAGIGIDAKGLIYTEDEVAANQQRAALQQAAQSRGPRSYERAPRPS